MTRVQIHEREGIVVVRLGVSQLTSDDQIQRTSDELSDVLNSTASGKRLILDFRPVERVASMMLGDLVALNKKAGQKGVQLQFFGFSPDVRRVIETNKLDRLFDILPDLPDGITSNE